MIKHSFTRITLPFFIDLVGMNAPSKITILTMDLYLFLIQLVHYILSAEDTKDKNTLSVLSRLNIAAFGNVHQNGNDDSVDRDDAISAISRYDNGDSVMSRHDDAISSISRYDDRSLPSLNEDNAQESDEDNSWSSNESRDCFIERERLDQESDALHTSSKFNDLLKVQSIDIDLAGGLKRILIENQSIDVKEEVPNSQNLPI